MKGHKERFSFYEEIDTKTLLLMIAFAYVFSVAMRMIWVYQVGDIASFYHNGELMINTNDGYFFAAGAQKALYGLHPFNPRVPDMWQFGVVALTTLLVKITPFSLETVILYLPAFISSLVVIPVILLGKLFKMPWWGFFAALLASVTWSYYNRTMTGYYDTDMFSAMAPMFILYFLIRSTVEYSLRSALYAALFIAIYPFLYDQGNAIVYAMGTLYALYMVFYHRKEPLAYHSIVLVFFALIPLPVVAPWSYLLKIVLIGALYAALKRIRPSVGQSAILAGTLFVAYMYFGNVFGLIFSKIGYYTATGTKEEGLRFYSVIQTVREASKVLFFPPPEGAPYQANIAHRMTGSSIGLVLALAGYVALAWRHRPFLLALPLIGIGVFAHWGGLRFTVYAVPIAAMSAVYLLYMLTYIASEKLIVRRLGAGVLTGALLFPNIAHIIEYRVPTVLNASEVRDLETLKQDSDPKDYTIAWWDYGYPIWFYSETNTLIDGGKHNNDNFIVSTIMQTDSPQLAVNLARLAVETYVSSGYRVVADTIFKDKDPDLLLEELSAGTYKLPPKGREIYLYMPYRMLQIFPTVVKFGNLDLLSGQEKEPFVFFPARAVAQKGNMIQMNNGMILNLLSGEVIAGDQTLRLKSLIVAKRTKEGKIITDEQMMHLDGEYRMIFMESYGDLVLLNERAYQSLYVQMFILGNVDKRLFETVVESPFAHIYKLKR